MKTMCAAAAAAALCLPTAALAQYDISNPSGTVRNFDIANLGPVITDLGEQWQPQDINGDGVNEILVNFEAVKVIIIPAACKGPNNTGCVGAQTIALFTSAPINQQAINAFNLNYAFASAGPLPQGWYMSRYDIADFGIARGNVEASLDSFLALLGIAYQSFSTGGSTVSLEGHVGDLASARLNEASAQKIGASVRNLPQNAGADHLREIEAMPEMIRAFAAKAGEESFNKIENLPKK